MYDLVRVHALSIARRTFVALYSVYGLGIYFEEKFSQVADVPNNTEEALKRCAVLNPC